MPKPQGLWAAMYSSLFDDPRTIDAAEVLVKGRVPRYVARQVVVTALLRLHVHALSEGDSGQTGHLTDRRLLDLAWPESADAPRNLGRRERLGALLRAALWAAPYGAAEGYMHVSCAGCAQQTVEVVQGIELKRCVHEGLAEFGLWHSKILGDRKRRRDRAARAAAEREREERAADDARTPGGAIPNPTQRTVREESPQTPREVVPPVTGPPALPADHQGFHMPLKSPDTPSAPRPVRGLVQEALGGMAPAGDGGRPVAAGAAPASRAPGGGDGTGLGIVERTRLLMLEAAPNTREQQRNGRDTTTYETGPTTYFV